MRRIGKTTPTMSPVHCSVILVIVLMNLLRVGEAFSRIESIEDEFVIQEPQYGKIEQMDIPEDQKLVVRLPSNPLIKYSSYKDVSILHFRVPPDTRAAYFTFKAFEESKSAFQRKCKPKDVTLHLKANSFPVISPENITFPKNFLSADQRFQVHNLQFQSDEKQNRIDIEGPQIGNWFAVAFVSWTDPNNDRIEQQGLAASCDTLLSAELSVSLFTPTILNDGQVDNANLSGSFMPKSERPNSPRNIQATHDEPSALPLRPEQWSEASLNRIVDSRLGSRPTTMATAAATAKHRENDTASPKKKSSSGTNNENIYKFYVPDGIAVATARIAFAEVCHRCPDVAFQVQANAYPLPASCSEGRTSHGNEHNIVHRTIISPNQTDEISIEFYVQPSTWHYAKLKFATSSEDACSTDAQPELRPLRHVAQRRSKAEEFEVHFLAYSLQIDYQRQVVPSARTHSTTANVSAWQPERFRGMDFYALLRQSYREFFMFDYDLLPDVNGTVPKVLNLTAHAAAGFAFELGEVYDIGGTLTFAVSMKNDQRTSAELKSPPATTAPPSERGGILAEKLIGGLDGEVLPMTKEPVGGARCNQSMQIIVCMHLGEPGVPTWPDKCRYGQRLLPASSIVNNTDNTGLIHVPFPESGLWYVTMGLYCHGAETARVNIINSVKEFVRQHADLLEDMRLPCACAANAMTYKGCISSRQCLAGMNETETLKVKECMMDMKCTADYLEMTRLFEIHHKLATEQHFALDNCNTSVVFSISSSPCVVGRCGRFGRCYHYMAGGFVFSTCVCVKGYRGWDCTEDSQVPSNISILMAMLLLTLSNLLFIPSVYMAFRRRYYTESVIYFFAMFFSIFYHACDSGEDEYSFCLVKIGVLQFCDFYCGLLAIWVTLIAMAHVPAQFVSLLHMFGAIVLAFGTELNKQSLWVFLAPALTGICLISTSWGIRCVKTRKWFPARRYLTIFMPFGTVLVMVGLVCYAFLQTRQNYHIVHSIWHMVMALSILCLLPSRKSFVPKC